MKLLTLAVRTVLVFWLAVTMLILLAANNDSKIEVPSPLARPRPPKTLIVKKQLWIVMQHEVISAGEGWQFLGLTDSAQHIIWLDNEMTLGEECETLHHEIKHAILGTHSDKIETEHEFIYDSSPDEVKVYFRDNPKLLAYSQQACRDFSDHSD